MGPVELISTIKHLRPVLHTYPQRHKLATLVFVSHKLGKGRILHRADLRMLLGFYD